MTEDFMKALDIYIEAKSTPNFVVLGNGKTIEVLRLELAQALLKLLDRAADNVVEKHINAYQHEYCED